jgi:hypothetical protein
VANAWVVSDSFAWSTPRVGAGFVDERSWTRLVPRGSNVLVLPTRDRTLASYWQVKAKFRFRLAIPGTPFVPRKIAGDPSVARLVDDVLPQLDGTRLAAARLRAFLIGHDVRAVVVEGRTWIDLARRATDSRPTRVGDVLVFPVAHGLRPVRANGRLVAGARLYFDGARAHVRVSLQGRTETVSSADGDAEDPSVATGPDGAAAVAFTEWTAGRVLMRVATNRGGGWRATTLDSNTLPIWTPRVAFTAGGAIVAGWVDDRGSWRRLRTAVQRNGRWQPARDLDRGQGLGVFDLQASAGAVDATWVDTRAAVFRLRTSRFDGTRWLEPHTLHSGFGRITGLASSS